MSENEAATANTTEQGSQSIVVVQGTAGEGKESEIRGETAGNTAETDNNDTANTQIARNDSDNPVQAQTAANEHPQPELGRNQNQARDVTAAGDRDTQESSTSEAAEHTQSSIVDSHEPPATRTASDLAAGSPAGPAGSSASTTAQTSNTQDVSTSEDALTAQASSPSQTAASDNASSGLAAAVGSTSEASPPATATTTATASDAAQRTSTSSITTPASSNIQRSTSSSGTAVAGTAGSGTSPTTSTSASIRPATTKKFTSSLSMNKKFLEKAGAATASGAASSADTRLSSAPSSISLPKAGPSFAALSPQTTTPSSQNASPTLASATASTSIPSSASGPTSTTTALTGASSSTPSSTLPPSTNTSAATSTVQPGSSHPRLLTGKLSTLSGGGIGLSSLNTPTATWGRPSPAGTNGATPSSAFGSRGFVPAPPVSGAQAPLSASGIGSAFGQARNASGGQRSSFASFQQGQGRAPQSASAGGGGGGQAPPWLHAARAAAGMSNARPLEHDFPSFQETARAEQQRQHALYAKEKAEKLAAVAQAAYNARVLDNLKSFSGIHDSADPNKTHWDELDDDDELEDILEFGDGTKYEVPPSGTLPLPSAVTAALEEKQGGKQVVNPTKDEVEAFRKAQKASNEAKALQVQYENTLAAAEAEISASAGHQQAGQTAEDGPVSKGERFVDDFDRRSGGQTQAGPSAMASAYESSAGAQRGPPTLNRESSANRTLFNERLGRFEPYAGGKKGASSTTTPGASGRRGDRRASRSPPAVLRRPSMGQGGGRPPSNGQMHNNAPNTAPLPSQILSPPKHHRQASSPLLAKQTSQSAQQQQPDAAPKKVENAWARPPTLAKQPPPGHGPPPSALQGPTPAEQSKQNAAVSAAASSAVPTQQQQPAQSPAQIQQPAQPTEDPEEAYKKEMQSIAERARKRRQDEEAERQAQIERARKKAQEIEEKMKAAASLTSPVVEQQPAAVQILAPQSSTAERSDRQASWRRASTDIAPTIQQRPQAARPPVVEAAPTSSSTPTISKPIQAPPSEAPTTSQKAPPSSAAFAALANMATSSFSSFRKPAQPSSSQSPIARSKVEASEPVVEKHATASPEGSQQQTVTAKDAEIVAHPAAPSLAKPSTPPPSLPRQPLDALLSPAPTVPTVRLGRTASSADISSSGSSTDLARMAFPQPTSMIASASQQQPATGKQDPTASLSQLDKIMLAVKAAQDGLTAANETKKRDASQKSHLDDALSKISQAMGQAAAQKGKAQQATGPSLPSVRYVPEIFEYTATERPPSPRIWKTFSMRLPSLKRELASVPYGKLRQFENPRVPYTVHSSSYIPAKGGRPHETLDEHLFPSPAKDDIPVVKFSKFRKLMSEATSAEANDAEELAIPAVQSIKLSPSTSTDVNRKGRSEAGSWRRMDPPPKSPLFEVFIEKESLTVTDPPYLAEQQEEDFTTVSYANLDFEEPNSSIKVSFPARPGQPTASQAVSPTVSAPSVNGQLSPESSSRFKTYGPKLPENSTLAFRRSVSANRGAVSSAGENMFIVTSEIAAREAESAAARTAFESVPQESASLKHPSEGANAPFYERMNGPATFQDRQPSPIAPTFPTLSPLHAEPLPLPVASVSARSVSPSRSPYESARKVEIPKNVQEELDRLNENVGSAPLTVPSRHDTPSSFLGRASSPWASGPGRAHGTGHFNILDPSMSVWSRPTEETAAAAAAASLAAGSADKPQENSLRGIIDEFPAGLPSSAMDMQLSESEQIQASPDKSLAVSPPELEKLSEEKPFQKNRTASAESPMPSHRETAAAEQGQHQRRATVNTSVSSGSRHGSFAYPSSQAFPGDVAVPSPYASHATLPYAPAAMPGQQSAYSPVMQAQYSPYVVSAPNAYGHQQYATAANGMQYSQYPMGMAGHDGRQAGMWVQTPMGPGMVNGQYVNGTPQYAHHQYAPQSMMPKGRGQAQYYGQPVYQAGHRAPPMPVTGATSYIPYAQRTAHAMASPQYSMFSPQLTSPPIHPQGYRASSAGPQQYSNRRGGPSPSQPW